MVREIKAAKKSYSAPSFHVLDPAAVKVKLEAVGEPLDGNAHKILSVIDAQLKRKTSVAHPALPVPVP